MQNSTPPIRTHYDVVVVGARAAGASTAMLLARHGLSVLAIDRGAYGSDTLSTHSLAGAGVLQLARWGLLDTIRDAGTPVANRVVFHYGDVEVAIEVPPRGPVDGLYAPRRTLLDATLVDAARQAGADVRHGVTMVGVITDPDGRANGVELDIGGDRRVVAADFVVGADGARSRVARQVGARSIREESTGAASIFGYFAGLPDDTIVNHYDTERVVGVIPTNDGLSVVWTGMSSARFERSARHDIAGTHAAAVASVPEFAEALRGRKPESGLRVFPGPPGFLKEAWGPGWALVGDAGYFKDPVSAHGITDALIGAELLADAIAAVLVGGESDELAMARYVEPRDEMAAAMMPPVARVAAFDSDLADVQNAFKQMSRAMRDEVALVEQRFVATV